LSKIFYILHPRCGVVYNFLQFAPNA